MKKVSISQWVLLFTLLFSSFSTIQAQLYKFQSYGVLNGICHPFVYSVNQDKNGFIWASTGTGLCRFDGFKFTHFFNQKDTLPESQAGVSFKDNDQNLWVGHNDGTIVFFDGRRASIIKPDSTQTGSINDIIEDKNGNIIIASQSSGLIKINKNFTKAFIKEPFQGKLVYALALTKNNQLLVGSDDGVFIFTYSDDPKKIQAVGQIEGLPLSKVTRIVTRKNSDSFWICTEDAGIFIAKPTGNSKYTIQNFGSLLKLDVANVQSVFEDKDSNIWISTLGKGLFKVAPFNGKSISSVINYNSLNGLGIDNIKNSFQDREGNIWVATYGNGLANLLNESFVNYDFKSKLQGKNILSVLYDKDGYWIGGEKGLLHVKKGVTNSTEFYGPSSGLPNDNVTALYADEKKTLWIGTDKNGIYQLASGAKRAVIFNHDENSLGNSINGITGKGQDIYVSTKNGVYKFGISDRSKQHFSTSEGLPHNNIRQVFIDSKGKAWVATRSNMLVDVSNNIQLKIKGNAGELDFTSIAEDSEGNIWAGTNGNGLFKFQKDTLYTFTQRDGLKADYCYSVTADKNGFIWVGHRLGLSRINSKTNQIKIFGTEYIPGDVNFNAASVSNEGNLLFGTTEGPVIYKPSIDRKTVAPPMINITSLIINDKPYDISEKIVLPYSYTGYRMKVEFIGLNYNNPDQVAYQYKLDGFDQVWSESSDNRVAIYGNLKEGNYDFKIKACNGDGVCAEAPLALELKIRKPFWETWWFIALSIIALVIGVYLIIQIRERKQKEFQKYLEKLLDERTKEVREQKDEIELKNRDITDSINYAQRIQASILPSLRKLQSIFTGSFVYYSPRNIVSGDFYWFEVIPDTTKFLMVCADSTGHGVPGAFMSIIGTTLLKDIFNRPDVHKPSDILTLLDNELKRTLNQDVDGERPNDGMDIIVCEIDTQTYLARFASAMRPFIVYQNGEQLYFKGSRSSIGGQMKEEKVFEDVELQLTKGDLIYMFSDGYPDQFGGPLGKKFKMVRLKNLLKDIHEKPMEEQYNYVKSNFDLWKGDLDQVDDILFMGIKI